MKDAGVERAVVEGPQVEETRVETQVSCPLLETCPLLCSSFGSFRNLYKKVQRMMRVKVTLDASK